MRWASWILSKDGTSAGTDNFFQGMFHDIEHRRLESLIQVQVARLDRALTRLCDGLSNSCIDIFSYILAIRDSTISITLVLVSKLRSAKMVVILFWVSQNNFPLTYSGLITLFSSSTILVPAARLSWAIWTAVVAKRCYEMQWQCPHRFRQDCAVFESRTTETRSSSCIKRIRGHSAWLINLSECSLNMTFSVLLQILKKICSISYFEVFVALSTPWAGSAKYLLVKTLCTTNIKYSTSSWEI